MYLRGRGRLVHSRTVASALTALQVLLVSELPRGRGAPGLGFKEIFAATGAVSPKHEELALAEPTWMPRSANQTFPIGALCLGKSIFAGLLRN